MSSKRLYKAPMFFNSITYSVKKYEMKRSVLTLQSVGTKLTSREVCIGDNLDILNDKYWNANLFSRLNSEHTGKHGCEISIILFDVISKLGFTTEIKDREYQA